MKLKAIIILGCVFICLLYVLLFFLRHDTPKVNKTTIRVVKVSERAKLVEKIKEWEQFRGTPYKLGGHYYIGYGHLTKNVKTKISKAGADSLLQIDIAEKLLFIRGLELNLKPNQELALASLLFTIKPADFFDSELFIDLVGGYPITYDWLSFCHFKGKPNDILLQRRAYEINLFNTK